MKQPILRIRKGAQIYDDGEPERVLPAASDPRPQEESARRRGPRPRGRLLLPVVVLAIALIAVLRFAPRQPQDRALIAGTEVVLRATVYGDLVLVSLTFARDPKSPPPGRAAAVHALLEIPETGASQELDGSLARLPEILRGQLAYADAARQVTAEVDAGGRRVTLSVLLR